MTRDEISEALAKMPFYEQIALARKINAQYEVTSIRYEMSHVEHYGCFQHNEEMCISKEMGDYCVYIWKHAWGEPFYVGSGKGNRWKQISANTRCNEFYAHLDSADALVYKIIDGVDANTARIYEKYVSFVFRLAGMSIVNGDYCVRDIEKAREFIQRVEDSETTKDVKKVLTDVMGHIPRQCDYRVTCRFIEKYGSDYFSRSYNVN